MHPFRGLFQRDRERIVHSSAFRRMTGKTQVLVASVNDHHRTRLTHTLEVTQVARTVARKLDLNEDLTEAIAIAHDIGHPPFGHAGEHALDKCLAHHGGFNHNLYGLKRVDELEERYPEFPGLNLTFEVREAFVRHANRLDAEEGKEFQKIGSPFLEALIVDAVDSIAYDTHDIDDALSLGFITLEDLSGEECWERSAQVIRKKYSDLPNRAFQTAVVRELLAWQVMDLIDETTKRLVDHRIHTLEDVRNSKSLLVDSSESGLKLRKNLERFLHERVYRNHKVLAMTAAGKRIVTALFNEFVNNPELLPERQLQRWANAESILGKHPRQSLLNLPHRQKTNDIEIVVGDYIAGMTDRFAQREYHRLFLPAIDL